MVTVHFAGRPALVTLSVAPTPNGAYPPPGAPTWTLEDTQDPTVMINPSLDGMSCRVKRNGEYLNNGHFTAFSVKATWGNFWDRGFIQSND